MNRRPVVLVDMDGVLADFDAELLRRLADRHPEVAILRTRARFYVADDYPQHKELVRAISRDAGFFSSLPLVVHAIQGWRRLIDLGYHPRICSSPISANPFSEREKRSWLEEHFAPTFGIGLVDEAVITKDKHLVPGIALIDDRPQIRNCDAASWRHILFDRSYNRHVPGVRLSGWLDDRLPEILEALIKV